jgi:hypothetical protein
MVREFLQNSADAKATKIDFIINQGGMSCADNGTGMDESTLIEGMLTMSGSIKGESSVGGFGAAKQLLLFQHESFTIRTGYIEVAGEGLEYTLDHLTNDEEDIRVSGTTIGVMWTDDYLEYSWTLRELIDGAKQYIRSCWLPHIAVTVNGESVPTAMEPGELVRELQDVAGETWAEIRSTKLSGGVFSQSMIVQVRGVTMFTEILAEAHPNQYILVVLKPSTAVMTSNRDGFAGMFGITASRVVQEIAMDAMSFGATYGITFIHPGRDRAYQEKLADFLNNTLEIRNEINAIIDSTDAITPTEDPNDQPINTEDLEGKSVEAFQEQIVKLAKARNVDIPTNHPGVVAYQNAIVEAIIEGGNVVSPSGMAAMAERCLEVITNLHADFVIRVLDKGVDEVPKNLLPEHMKGRTLRAARVWKYCLRLALLSRAHITGKAETIKYRIGWCLSESTLASKSTSKDTHTFLVNPAYLLKMATHRELFHKALQVACHEVTHLDSHYHGEVFSGQAEDTFMHALLHTGSWWKHYQDAASETI